ncbi:MAG: hypothetical protein R2695_11165 [Acidimicrobiales bacterium]
MRATQPAFIHAVRADLRITAARRGERFEFTSRLDMTIQAVRLCIVSDAFLSQVCYRAKVGLQRRRVPLLPRLFHRLAIATGQICIGDPVVVEPGVYLPHGQVVIDGLTHVGERVVIAPFVTIGLLAGDFRSPTIGVGASLGTGAKVLGPVTIGAGAQIGANAVVVSDVPPGRVAVGVPARIVGES